MRISLEKKILVTLIVFGLGVLLIIIGVIIPSARALSRHHTESIETLRLLEKSHSGPINLRELIQKIKTLTPETANFTQHTFKAGNELQLITELETIAAKTGVTQKIDSSNFDAITNQKARFSLSASGEYAKLFRYLEEIEALPYFIALEQVTLSPSDAKIGTTLSSNTSLHLVVSVYVNP
jgi:Tfp pilus assembly protein PilO